MRNHHLNLIIGCARKVSSREIPKISRAPQPLSRDANTAAPTCASTVEKMVGVKLCKAVECFSTLLSFLTVGIGDRRPPHPVQGQFPPSPVQETLGKIALNGQL